MEIFIPLIIFWVVTSVIKGLQREQAGRRGQPLPRPQPRREEPVPERSTSDRRRVRRDIEAEPPEQKQPSRREYQPKGPRAPRQQRLVKEGDTGKPLSRLQEEVSKEMDVIAQQELQVMQTQPVATIVRPSVSQRVNPLARVKRDLNRSEALTTAILYTEILGAPRSQQPHRTPLKRP